jgi:exopolysaccharide/PEP-CTERM locus tyrosine autokinase
MSSLIELAAQRLEQLRGTGVRTPASGAPEAEHRPAAAPAAVPAEAPVRARAVSRRIELDLAVMKSAGIVTPDDARSQLADQYRVIKRPLLRNAATLRAASHAHGNLIMVTSALPGEGKSFTAVNLAMSIAAELDHTVMLVDADVARPSVPRLLGFTAGPGLLDVLEGKAELHEVLLRTDVDKLTVLPSGLPQARATELLASEAMHRLLSEMATRYADRIIVFDSPPLLLTTESRVLATHMGQIVVIVQAERTSQSAVQRALATIETHPLRMLVLNQARGDAERGGDYGYEYRYRYGHGDVGTPGGRDGG